MKTNGFSIWILLAIGFNAGVCADIAVIAPLSKKERQEYAALSPFEFKNVLIDQAKAGPGPMLDAGRGNPNFINTRARYAFSLLHRFAVDCSLDGKAPHDMGYSPVQTRGMAVRFSKFLSRQSDKESAAFLSNCLDYVRQELRLDPDVFTAEMVDAILGDHYPTPPRMLTTAEKVVEAYLKAIHFPAGKSPEGHFQLFATEGATAAMIYVFNTLKENFILQPGDQIAIITPIFSPYLEIPVLNDYQLKPIYVQGSEATGWQVPDRELDKLKNKKIKALFMVNPMNPGAVSMNAESVDRIARVIRANHPELIVLTDTVYAPFVNEFHDLLEAVPGNCIGVYSYSKYFGVTGWRLGVIFIHENNVFDRMIARLPADKKERLNRRYLIDTTNPQGIPFIERLLMDSRDVALAHTGGLSTPQQCVMTLFSLYELLDKPHAYKKSIQAILRHRLNNLYAPLQMAAPEGNGQTCYYNLINLQALATRRHGKEFADYLVKTYTPFGFLLQLAQRHQTVLLPGVGFAGPEWSVRVSLANLPADAYTQIGNHLVDLLDAYHQQWSDGTKGK